MDDLVFTGERLVPSVPGYEPLFREHLARYALLASRARGRRVLDAGCGAGYGAFHLGRRGAESVEAVDLSPDAVQYASSRFPHDRVTYRVADLMDLSEGWTERCFDLITCFEVIEHLRIPELFLDRARRLLGEEGELWLSTPNLLTYRPGTSDGDNPFHVHEYDADELRDLLGEYFEHVDLFVQVPIEAELILREGDEAGVAKLQAIGEPAVSLWGEPARVVGEAGASSFLLARCAGGPAPEAEGSLTFLWPPPETGTEVLRYEHRLQRAWDEVHRRGCWALDLKQERDTVEARCVGLELEVEERTAWALAMKARLEAQRPPTDGEPEAATPRAPGTRGQVALIEAGRLLEIEERSLRIRQLEGERQRLEAELEAIRNATFWRLSAPLRGLLDKLRGLVAASPSSSGPSSA